MRLSRRRAYRCCSATRRPRPARRTAPAPVILALGAVLAGVAIPAAANAVVTILGATSSNLTMYRAEDFWFTSAGTIDTAQTPALSVDPLVTNSTITLSAGARLASTISTIGVALYNQGQVINLANSGTIAGSLTGIDNAGSIGTLSNSGTISGASAIVNSGSIGTLVNSGRVSGDISITGSVTTLSNSGTIGGTLVDAGTLGALSNSGTISGGISIGSSGSVGVISNSGTISGNIVSSAASGLTFAGGSGGTTGTLTGGTISVASGGVNFASGRLLLNDNVNVGSGTVSNSATLSLASAISITGNYSQSSSGALNLGTGGELVVSGAASLDGTVSASLSSTGNYIAGSGRTLVSTGTLTTSGLTTSITGPIGVNLSVAVSGTNLIASYDNDYIGGSLASLAHSGTIDSTYGVYIAGSGSLGTLSVASGARLAGSSYAIDALGTLGTISNAGTIAGNIARSGTATLTIDGGSSDFGTLTGYSGGVGTISNTASDVVFGSGKLLLNDNIDVGSHTVSNSGATLRVDQGISISGNYSQDAAASLLIGVSDAAVAGGSASSDAGYGRLTVSGSASIASGSSIALTRTGSTYAFAQGQRYVVIVANATGTNYNASTLDYSAAGYSGTLSGAAVADGANSDLVVTLGNAGSSSPLNEATHSNASQALSGLFNYSGTQAQLLNLFNAAAAAGGDSATANAVGAQLSPIGIASGTAQVATATGNAAAGVVRSRLGQLRTGGSGGSGSAGLSAGDEALDKTVWAQAFGGRIDQAARDGVSGYTADYSGFLVGADRALGERWHVGTAFAYAASTLKENDANSGSSVRSQSYGVHVYGGYDGDGYYLDLDGSVDALRYDSARRIAFSGFSSTAHGDYDGMQFQTSAEIGWPIKLGGTWRGTTLTPIVNLTYTGLHQSAYTESGGDGAALKVAALHDDSLTSQLGARLERDCETRWGPLTPYVQLGWRHEYLDTRLQTSASYAADTSGATAFVNTGARPQSDTAVLALGATLQKSEQLELGARLQYDSASGYGALSGNIALRYRF